MLWWSHTQKSRPTHRLPQWVGIISEEEIFLKAISVKAIDTTGAGDAFNGGFAFSLFQGKKIKECLEIANKVAGLSTTKLGACNSNT